MSAVVLLGDAGSAEGQGYLGSWFAGPAHGWAPQLSGLEFPPHPDAAEDFQEAAETYVTVLLALMAPFPTRK